MTLIARILIVLSLLGLCVPATAVAQSAAPAAAQASWTPQARAFVDAIVVDVTAIARAGGTEAATRASLRTVLGERLATDRISRFLIGANRAAANPDQLAQYDELMPRFIVNQFADQIDELATQKIVVGDVVPRSAREVLVRSQFNRRNGSKVSVDWRVTRDAAGELRLLDVYVNGVSPLVAQREEFTSVVKRDGFAALLAYIAPRAA